LLSCPGASPAAVGQEQSPCSAISGVWLAFDISALDQLLHELTGSLLGHPEMLGNLGGRGTTRSDPDECESVRGPHVGESVRRDPGLNAIDDLGGEPQHQSRLTKASERRHVDSLS
jgi:hypothetical protein